MTDKKLLINSNGKALITEEGKILLAPPNAESILKEVINISENGVYDVKDYKNANVNVQNTIPDGYIKPTGKVEITSTKEVDVTQYAKAQVVDPNLTSENIAENVTVLGITGTFKGGVDTSDATATANDILLGKTAYVNDIKVEGSIETYDGSNSEMTEPLQSTLKKLLDAKKSCSYLFYEYKGTSVDDLIKYDDTEKVEKMDYMFYLCESLQTIPLLNTSNVINMRSMFYQCYALTTIPLLDTSKVTNMYYMFSACKSLTTIPQLDTSEVTNMYGMFDNCENLTTIPQLDTSNVTDMHNMFSSCFALTTIPLLDTSKVTKMDTMFYQCYALTTIPLLNTSKVTTMEYMFASCYKLMSIPALNVRSVTNMSSMFSSCSKLTTIQMYGMKVSFNISASTQFEESDLVTIISNCQVVTSSTTLTMGRTNLAKLENVYVKETGVELYEGITCRPCVICESTDDGAMLVTTYASNKGWTLA